MGRHRDRRAARTARQVVVGVAVLALLGGGIVGYRALSSPGCRGAISLSVAASSEIAPAVAAAAESWEDTTEARVNDRCIAVVVTAVDSADVAASIARSEPDNLVGLSSPNSTAVVPDVWIPDSSLWIRRLMTVSTGLVPSDPPSIARSPVVLAAPESVAASFGWPDANVTWSDVLSKAKSDGAVRIGIVDPTRDAASLASLVSMTDSDEGDAEAGTVATQARAAVVEALRALAKGRATTKDELVARYPTDLSLAPLSEQTILAYNSEHSTERLVGLAMLSNPSALDYPYTVLPDTTGDKEAAAAALRTLLAGSGFRDRLSEVGLRASDGTTGADFPTSPVTKVDPSTQALVPDGTTANQAVATWTALTASSRMLAILDVSGSMLETVPTANDVTRMELTIQAASQGLALFDDSWSVGLWTFSTNLDGDRDYRQLAPIEPLIEQRTALAQQLLSIVPKSTGDTGLYDTVLAAYQTVQSDWDSSRVNSVVLLTDGENDDDNGISLEQLIGQLTEIVDPDRPIQVILLGIGTDTSETSMREITDVTGGGVFIAEDPANIGDIFLQAIALRSSNIISD